MGTFDESLVKSLSESFSEPAWLEEARLQAFHEFASLPLEKNPLYTKYARIGEFDVGQFGVSKPASAPDLRTFFQGFLTGHERNILLQGNETEVHWQIRFRGKAPGLGTLMRAGLQPMLRRMLERGLKPYVEGAAGR